MTYCPFCNFKIEKGYIEKYFSQIDQKEYYLYECDECLLKFFVPLEINQSFYEDEKFEAYAIWHQGLRNELPAYNRMFFKYLPPLIKNNSRRLKLLDVGCAEGIFLKEAERQGYEVWGIDFDKKSIKVAKEKFGLRNVFPLDLEEFYNYAINKNLKFDVITFFEVLEHQTNPNRFLKIIYDLCDNGGYIAGSVPNSEGFFKGLGGYPPHHFLWFNKKNLEIILVKSGFENIKVKFVEQTFLEVSSHAQAILLGKIGLKLRNFIIKKLLISNETSDSVNVNSSSLKKYLFLALKKIRDYLFLPISLILYVFINSQIYFYARKK